MIRELFAVGIGGAAGSVARYLLCYGVFTGVTLWGFPAGTFIVNALGSLLIGVLLEVLRSQTATWILVVGFCGGFTTFSAFSVDAVRLLKGSCYGSAATYIALSVVVCLVCTAVGIWIGQLIKN